MSTGYVYHPIYLEHNLSSHPENARRLERIMEMLEDAGVLARLTPIEPRPATEEELERVHTPALIAQVRRMAERGGGYLDPDTYTNARSYDAALMAAGGLLAAVEAIFSGEIENGFALVRPPGHHATPTRPMGFCLFNNVAVAARHALTFPAVQRVLIVDFDVHHGNGTQDIFEADPHVLYVSTHEYPFYPGTGHWTEIGRGEGKGTVLNIPLPAGVGDQGYRRVFQELIWPLARRFQPHLILVSAGYDAHWQDPLAMMRLTLTGYNRIARELVQMAQELCAGRILFTLEGGYNLDVLAHGVLNTLYALLGEKTVSDPFGAPATGEPDISDLIEHIKEVHRI
ncbi:MAG TPA: histone deacetylase [Anaerolineales bacterium]|nr:histone deacetylase [Anaerolineales bacterium]